MFVSRKESITIDLINNGLQMKSVSSIKQLKQLCLAKKASLPVASKMDYKLSQFPP